MLYNALTLAMVVSTAATASSPSAADYTNLESALKTSFLSPQNIPKLVRMSFHDLINFDKATGSAGAQGCLFDQRVASFPQNNGLNATAQALKAFVIDHFPTTDFPSGAGKVAIESVYPCIKVEWEFGRHSCTANELAEAPPPSINSAAAMQPFLDRYGLSMTEMAVLTTGAHAVSGAVNSQQESGVFDFTFAPLTAKTLGTDFIKKSATTKFSFFGGSKSANWYGDATNPFSGTALGRFPSDMLFFPTAQQNNVDPVPDDIDTSAEIAAVETTLTGLDEMSFNTRFGKVVAKMFKIGTSSSLTPFSTGSTTC